jgi:hypothetical protein
MTIENTCEDNGTKVDVVGDHATVEVTAPDGFLISGYCVKAGSARQGDGPELVVVDPPAATVTISHSSGKDVSHYTIDVVPVPTTTTEPPTTTTEPPTTTTAPPFEIDLSDVRFDMPHPATPILDRSITAPPVEVATAVEVAPDPAPVELAYTGVSVLPLVIGALLALLVGVALRRKAKQLDREVASFQLGADSATHYLSHGGE